MQEGPSAASSEAFFALLISLAYAFQVFFL